MNLFQQMFSDWVGILSVFTVVFVLVMAGFIAICVACHVRKESGGKPHPR